MIDIFYYDGKLKEAKPEELEKLKDKLIWVDIIGNHKSDAQLIGEIFDLHQLTVEDLLRINTRIKVEEFPNYLFCVFYGIQKHRHIEMIEFDFVVGKNFLITSHSRDTQPFIRVKSNAEKLEALFKKGIDFTFHTLLDMEIDNYFPVLESIDDEIDLIEEKVTENPEPKILTEILKLKRLIVLIKKISFPQREKIAFLAKNEYGFISKKVIPYFRDVYDHTIRVSDTIEDYREAVSNTYDAYMSSISNKLNEVMKTLSIIATIALPLTVISGIYGTNFAHLPGENNPYGFYIMLILMASLTAGMILFFRRRKWF